MARIVIILSYSITTEKKGGDTPSISPLIRQQDSIPIPFLTQIHSIPIKTYLIIHKHFPLLHPLRLRHTYRRNHIQLRQIQLLLGVYALLPLF